MPTSEASIQAAIRALDSGDCPSVKRAAKDYNVPRSTLRNRLAGRQTNREAHEQQQRLTHAQEEYLTNWVIELDDGGYPPTHARLREIATHILRLQNDPEPLGQLWTQHFIRRNPHIATCIGKKIEGLRVEGTTREAIQGFFDCFQRVQTKHNVQLQHTWNADETGFAIGVTSNTRVMAEAGKGRTYVKSPENREWVTSIETISATGLTIRPLVIFKGKAPQSTWFNEDTPWIYTTSENGWTANRIAMNWLHKMFFPVLSTSASFMRA